MYGALLIVHTMCYTKNGGSIMAKLGFIGMGNMGYALLKGIKSVYRNDIIFHRNNREKMLELAKAEDITYADNNRTVVEHAKYIILAIKPQMFDVVLEEIRPVITKEHIIISLAPGITLEQLKEKIGEGRAVRTMPNTPAMVGEGMTGIALDEKIFQREEIDIIEKIFESVGKIKIVPETLIDSVVCASGSSPAYVFMFIEALADSVVKCGMKRDDAYEFVAQTVLGSAKLMLDTKKHPGELKDMVCSPGGTTITAVEELERNGFRKSIFAATEACFHKCKGII